MKKLRPILLTLLTATALHAQKYAVRMSHPVHPGQTYVVSATGSTVQRMSVGERVLKAVDYQVTFEGRAEILDVDGKGEPVKIAFTVEKLTRTEGDTTTDLLKSGSVIISDSSQPEPISLKEGSIEDSVREAFHVVHSPHKPGDITDDEVFGTEQARSIGESWPINSARAAESLKDTGVMQPAERLSGTVTLVAKEKIAAIDCLSLRGEIKADSFVLKESPPGFTLDRGNLEATFRGCFPLEGSAAFRQGGDFTMQARLSSKEGVSVETKISQKQDVVWRTPAK